ncbi:MAG: hypothetical protein N3E49_09235 [Bacteroidia bacterium]|nr:hypothetical protein [Bacteroidia bacterium]
MRMWIFVLFLSFLPAQSLLQTADSLLRRRGRYTTALSSTTRFCAPSRCLTP